MEVKMDAEFLGGAAGLFLSLLFSYIPGFNGWFDKLDGIYKRLVMGGLILLVGAGAFGLACAGLYDSLTCDQAGAVLAIKAVFAALVVNQGVYTLTKA
jgi:hypothetical protein